MSKTVRYKGFDVAADVAPLVRHMDGVEATREALQSLQGTWDHLSMLGEFSGAGIEIASVRSAFEALSGRLVDQLAGEARHKAMSALQGRAQVAIDVLVRNLFERTADIGFLATDDNLRRFAQALPAERDASRPALLERLGEYQRSYSVYDDAVLLDPAGAVLARLAPGEVGATDDALVGRALGGSAAYVEAFGRFALQPGRERSLLYAQRVLSSDGARAVGVLCLSFRLDDECRRIFEGLCGPDDWTVLALVDACGRVIASSDALQLPPGTALDPAAAAGTQLIHFRGRRWLAATCTARAYQGYAGPGWRGVAMVPLDLAFDAGDGASAPVVPVEHAAALAASPLLFPAGLRAVAEAARGIEADLRRAVWNGHVALGRAPAGRDSAFSKVLLREIGRTGANTREVFTRAIADLDDTVVSSLLDDTGARAALAIDLLDRNLYERANDCRWWALTGAFRSALENGPVDAAGSRALTAVLQAIHGLYTVYANLLLFDRDGRVVASARPDDAAPPGRMLAAEWVPRTLALADTQAWTVSAFEPSPLYAGRPTCIYGAAVRGLAAPGRVVGGIAIVFDAAPQLEAMLADALPRDAGGAVRDGSFNLFVDDGGRVLAHSGSGPAVGSIAGPCGPAGASGPQIVERDGRLWACGARASSGYREYRGGRDPARSTVSARCFVPLTSAAQGLPCRAPSPTPLSPRRATAVDAERVDLASFQVAGQWYALRASEVVEATSAAQRVLPLPQAGRGVRGSLVHGARPVLVVDLAHLLDAPGGGGGVVIVVRGNEAFPSFGLWVDALGDNPEIEASALQGLGTAGSLVAAVVRPDAEAIGQDLLRVLSPAAIAAAAFGRREFSRAA